MARELTAADQAAVDAFRNFLSWECRPVRQCDRAQQQQAPTRSGAGCVAALRGAPPAVIAYVLGYTAWCPPKGEL